MRSLSLGPSGVAVTHVVAGAARAPVPVARGVELLDEGWELGTRALDVADATAERETAAERFLDDRQPDEVAVLAGVGATADPGRGSDLSPERLDRDLATAARRLGRVDLAWTRGTDAATPLEASLTALAEALETGRMQGWGASGVDVWALDAWLTAADRAALPRPAFVRIRLNLLERAGERDLLPLATGEGLGVLARAPFAHGRLTDRHIVDEEALEAAVAGGAPRERDTDPALPRLLALRGLARERDVTTAALALGWLLAHPSVTAVVAAPRAKAEWDPVHEALETELDEELLERVGATFR